MADSAKISETLEFLTQIHKAWDNSEQRAALRMKPRRSLAYDYVGMKPWQSQYIRAMAYARQTEIMQIPLWHSAWRLDKNYPAGTTTMVLPKTLLWQYRGCDYIQLWTSDGFGGEIYPVHMYFSDGSFILAKGLLSDYKKGTVICPVAWVVLSQEDKYSNATSAYASMTMNFEIVRESQAPDIPDILSETTDEEVKAHFARNLEKTYKGTELLLTPPEWANEITANFKRNAYRMDNDSGVFLYDLRSDSPIETRELNFILQGRNEINNLQRFFCRCKGRLHSFYAPTWLNDVDLVQDAKIGDITLLAAWPHYWKYFSTGSRRKTLIVFYKDGTAQILPISGYTTDDTGEHGKILLASAIKRSVTKKETALISFLCRYRLNNDALTTEYDTVELASTSLTLAEVDE